MGENEVKTPVLVLCRHPEGWGENTYLVQREKTS